MQCVKMQKITIYQYIHKLSWRVVKDSLKVREFNGTLKETANERQQFYDDIMELGVTAIGEFLGEFPPPGTNRPYQYITIEDWRWAGGIRLVFFDTNGGEGEPDIAITTGYLYIPSDAVPVKEGYIFNGWSLDRNSTEQGMMPDGLNGSVGWYDWNETEDTTVYALWKSDGSHTPETTKGDLDYDGEITSYDAYLALKYSVSDNVSDTIIRIADIDNDNNITSYEAYKILKISIGL